MKKVIKAIDIILKEIDKPKNQKHFLKSFDVDCPQCKIVVLGAYLEWFKDLNK